MLEVELKRQEMFHENMERENIILKEKIPELEDQIIRLTELVNQASHHEDKFALKVSRKASAEDKEPPSPKRRSTKRGNLDVP